MASRRAIALAMFTLLAGGIGALLGGACGSDAGDNNNSGQQSPPLVVLAPTALREAADDLARAFERREGVTVTFELTDDVADLTRGEQADVYTSPDAATMDLARVSDLVEEPRAFATNLLAIVTPADEPRVRLLADLGTPGLRMMMPDLASPLGRHALTVLDRIAADDGFAPGFREAVLASVVPEQASVPGILERVRDGDADAGFVYVTDVPDDEQRLEAVDIPLDFNVRITHQAAVATRAENREDAARFVEFLLSVEGQEILERHAFDAPD